MSAILCPIANDAVAAGDGALHTWMMLPLILMSKSSSSVPWRSQACARMPDSPASRCSAWIVGMRFCKALTKACLLNERWYSPIPVRQCFAATLWNPGQVMDSQVSCRLNSVLW